MLYSGEDKRFEGAFQQPAFRLCWLSIPGAKRGIPDTGALFWPQACAAVGHDLSRGAKPYYLPISQHKKRVKVSYISKFVRDDYDRRFREFFAYYLLDCGISYAVDGTRCFIQDQ